MIVFRILPGAFCVVAVRVVIDFVRSPSDTLHGPLLSITSGHGHICRSVFSRKSFRYSNRVEALAPVVEQSISNCVASDAWSDDTVSGMLPLSTVTVSVTDERMQYRPNLRESNFEYDSLSSQSATVASNSGRLTPAHF